MSVLEARSRAQHLAFGPLVFQGVRSLWKSGVLERIAADDAGVTVGDLERQGALSPYALGVLLDVAESAGVVRRTDGRYSITRVGSMILYDRMTQVNMNFVHDVCYQGGFHLDEALVSGKPAGLRVFSDAETIYECVPRLPDAARESWYAFDHYYSDRAFGEAAEIVFSRPVGRLMDVGGNTGNWASRCMAASDAVRVTLVDLPGQLELARERLKDPHSSGRVAFFEADLLGGHADLPGDFDVIWMSQFLDCFPEQRIRTILRTLRSSLAADGRLYVMETFTDNQRHEAASYSLNAISLYFTALANGNSRMYRLETLAGLLRDEGYRIVGTHENLGVAHTLLECVLMTE